MNDRPSEAVNERVTPRARHVAQELGVDLDPMLQETHKIAGKDVVAGDFSASPGSVATFESSFLPHNAMQLIEKLHANTLRGETPPALSDLFIKAVFAALEVQPLPKLAIGHSKANTVGLYQMTPPTMAVVSDLHTMGLREIAALTADLASGGLPSGTAGPPIVTADSLRWGLTNLQQELPASSLLMFTLVADPANLNDHVATIRVQFRTPPIPAETAAQILQMLIELMTEVQWSLH